MGNKKLFSVLVSVLTFLMLLMCVSFSTFATDQYDSTDSYYNEEEQNPVVPDETQVVIEQETSPPVVEEYEDNSDNAEFEYNEDATVAQPIPTPQVEKNETEKELPKVSKNEVPVPTTMDIPEVEVTDVSLMGGVIAWLCVAVGIAVLAGVLVSQRTKQVQRPKDRR